MMLRLANAQGSSIVDANIQIHVMKVVESEEGQILNKIFDITPMRDHTPFFALSWNILHKIDEQSPFYGLTKEEITKQIRQLIVTIKAHEQIYAQEIYNRKSYFVDDFEWDRDFVDVISNKSRYSVLNLKNFHSTKPSINTYWT